MEPNVKFLPRFIAVPKPGQSADDDDCPHVFVTHATVQDMTVFLLQEPPDIPPEKLTSLTQFLNLARLRGKPTDNFFQALGIPPDLIKDLEEAIRKDMQTEADA